ncbi:MAG: zinc ABC transporter substrate-binding protein [Clostridia bacterium]|nr:zinc ABC transporter substrate-binding protein [Clostridia bacterium]
MKKLIFPLLFCLLFCGCRGLSSPKSDKLKIVATLFPQYDFARTICGEKAEIYMLLPPGSESHSYEPTPKDLARIAEADLFLYTGSVMEPWAHKLSENALGMCVDVSRGVPLLSGDHIHETHSETDALETTDPHIWTNPQNAKIMVDNILKAVSEKDPANAPFYAENAKKFKEQLDTLDKAFEDAVRGGKRKHIVFGGHFAMRYFTERYGLRYDSAYDACSGEAEPSPSVMIQLIEKMKKDNIPVIYYEELSTPRTASLIAEETGAKMLLLHSCHNIGKGEENETYLSLMYKNLENLKIGLN